MGNILYMSTVFRRSSAVMAFEGRLIVYYHVLRSACNKNEPLKIKATRISRRRKTLTRRIDHIPEDPHRNKSAVRKVQSGSSRVTFYGPVRFTAQLAAIISARIRS